jgi:poly(A) polymerase
MSKKNEILSLSDPILKKIGSVADEQAVEAYVVGGYVRDLILERPVKDIDIVVVGDGVAFARVVASVLQKKNIVVYEKFGTAMLPLENGIVEFVGARKESYSGSSRKPDVEDGTLAEDLARRDFTVNALAASLNAQRYGEVVDPYDGKTDIARKLLRTPLEPDRTFTDDPLRMMRAVRFAAQIGFSIDPDAFAAIAKMKDRLSIVSQERITDEFLKLMKSDRPSLGLKLMFESGMMQIVLPEVAAMAGVDQRDDAVTGNDDGRKYYHKDVFLHTLKVVDNISSVTDNVWLRFAALVHDIAKPRTKMFREGIGWSFYGHEEIGARMQKGIFNRLRLPLDYLPYVEKIVRLHLRPMALVDDGVTDSAVRRLLFEAGNEVDDLMVLCKADITSKNPALVVQYTSNYDRVHAKMTEVEEKDRIRNWQPPVKGDEIMKVCGIEPGPLVGKLKTAIEDAILDGRIPNDHDAALEYLLSIKKAII